MLGKGSAGGSRAAMDSGLQLDKCKCYLESLGFGPRELATLDINDSAAIAKQLAFECASRRRSPRSLRRRAIESAS